MNTFNKFGTYGFSGTQTQAMSISSLKTLKVKIEKN